LCWGLRRRAGFKLGQEPTPGAKGPGRVRCAHAEAVRPADAGAGDVYELGHWVERK